MYRWRARNANAAFYSNLKIFRVFFGNIRQFGSEKIASTNCSKKYRIKITANLWRASGFTLVYLAVHSFRMVNKDELTQYTDECRTTHSFQIPWRKWETSLTCCLFLFLFSNIFLFAVLFPHSLSRSIQHQIERNRTERNGSNRLSDPFTLPFRILFR